MGYASQRKESLVKNNYDLHFTIKPNKETHAWSMKGNSLAMTLFRKSSVGAGKDKARTKRV
jgi:hypothetical protein